MGHFLPFYSSNSAKNQNFEKMKKKPADITILHICTKNYDQIIYGSWDKVCDRCNYHFSFWAIFCPFTPLTAKKNQNFEKMKKTPEDIIILHKCTKNYHQTIYSSWDMLRNGQTDGQTNRRTDGWTDGRKKWHIEVGAPPKNWGPGLYNSLHHTDNRKYFLGLSLTWNWR